MLGVRLWQASGGLVPRRGEDFPGELITVLHSLGVATDGIVDIRGPTVRNWVVYEASGERHWIYRTPRERSREVAVQAGDLPVAWVGGGPPPAVPVTATPPDAGEGVVETGRRLCPPVLIRSSTQ